MDYIAVEFSMKYQYVTLKASDNRLIYSILLLTPQATNAKCGIWKHKKAYQKNAA